MTAVDVMRGFLEYKEKLDDVERQDPYVCPADGECYEEEFRKLRELSQSFKTDDVYPSVEAMKSCNVPKNRFKDIVPFDYTRVKLKAMEEGSTSDYINASFIKGAIGDQQYIAAQGPLPKTVNDFWQMLWDYDVRVVLMACREYEGQPPKLKCQRYWPNSTTEELLFGNIRVTLEREEKTSYKEHLIRHMLAKVDDTSRKIVQFHYMDWPDAGVPRSIPGILDLIERLREAQPLSAKETPPVLFHCSAGCGRTGTMIVIDFVKALLKYGRLTQDFKLYDIIVELRRQRMAIVQSLDQFVFVHEIIAVLFKRELEIIDSHLYGNVGPKQQQASGNPSIYQRPQNNVPIKTNSLIERLKPAITSRRPRISDPNTDSPENSPVNVTYAFLQKDVKPKPQVPPSPTLRNLSTEGTKESCIASRPNSKNSGYPAVVPCEYETTESLNRDAMKKPVIYETIDDIGSQSPKKNSSASINGNGPMTGSSATMVSTDNPQIIYKGINISYPNRYSKKPRGKRPFRTASATAKAF